MLEDYRCLNLPSLYRLAVVPALLVCSANHCPSSGWNLQTQKIFLLRKSSCTKEVIQMFDFHFLFSQYTNFLSKLYMFIFIFCFSCMRFVTAIHINKIKVSERVLSRDEIPWESLKQIGRESLRQMQRTRFYLQPKEVPCSENLAVFVSNLPFNLSQRQYEKILLDILGKGSWSLSSFCKV